MKELTELREKLVDELKGYGKKDMSAGSLVTIDTLAHAVKNLDKIIGGNSYDYYHSMRHRDEMGRYARDGLVDKLHEMMDEAPDERTKQEFRRFISKMESM